MSHEHNLDMPSEFVGTVTHGGVVFEPIENNTQNPLLR